MCPCAFPYLSKATHATQLSSPFQNIHPSPHFPGHLEQINSRRNHLPHWPVVQLHVFPHLHSSSSNRAAPPTTRPAAELGWGLLGTLLPPPLPHSQQIQSQRLLYRCQHEELLLSAKNHLPVCSGSGLRWEKGKIENGKEETEKEKEEEKDRGKDWRNYLCVHITYVISADFFHFPNP